MRTIENVFWKGQALKFVQKLGKLQDYQNINQFINRCTFLMKELSFADQVILIKEEDHVTNRIVLSTEKELEGTIPDMACLRKYLKEDVNYLYKLQETKALYFLSCAKCAVAIRVEEHNFCGYLLLAWEMTMDFQEGFQEFVSFSVGRFKEVAQLYFSYLSFENLKAKFNAIFLTVPQSVIFFDDQALFAWVNPRARKMLGITERKTELAPSLVSEKMKSLRENATNKATIEKVAALKLSSGNQELKNWIWTFPNKVWSVTVKSTDSEFMRGILWIFEDITELYFANQHLVELNRNLVAANKEIQENFKFIQVQHALIKEAKDEIEAKNQKLEEINEEKKQVISIVSHALRSPLNKIMGLLQLLEIKEKDSAKTKKIHTMIKDVTNNGLTLIQNLLDINVLEPQIAPLQIERANIKDCLINWVASARQSAELKQISVDLIFLTEQCDIRTDLHFAQRIFDNLISNAIKFSVPNTQITVKLDSDGKGGNFILSITDQGKGIPKEEHHMVFQKYSNLSTKPTTGESSSGLGLSIVKSLVETLHGRITFDSGTGMGTTFTVELPASHTE